MLGRLRKRRPAEQPVAEPAQPPGNGAEPPEPTPMERTQPFTPAAIERWIAAVV